MPIRSVGRIGLAVVAWLFVACILIQVFLAGLGVFDRPAAFTTHREFGYLFGWLIPVMIGLGIAGDVPRRFYAWMAIVAVQFILQSVLVALRSDFSAVAALHPVNGVVMLVMALVLAREATALARRSDTAPSPRRTSVPGSDRQTTGAPGD
jgi:hypothetical protein